MRYQVARTSPDDVHEVLTRVADVEGLFAQPRLPARRQLVLHDGPEVTGDFVIEVLDDRRPMRWWDVVDPVVRDGVVTASVCLREERPCALVPLEQPRYRIFQGDRFLGWCRDVEGLPEEWPGCEWPPVTLLGCDDPGRVRSTPSLWQGIEVLDDTGRVMARVPLDLSGAEVRTGGDVVLDLSRDHGLPHWRERPLPAARPVWEVWSRGLPQEPGLWASFDTAGRQAWLDLTFVGHETRHPRRTSQVHGSHVTDLPSLFLALSEAFVGPGNYFGRGYDSFRVCLDGVAAGSTLVWHGTVPEKFLDIVMLLRSHGVSVELDSTSDELDRRTALRELVERWKPGWAKAGGREYRHVLTDDNPHELDRTAAQSMVSSSDEWLLAPTHSPAAVTETLSRHGMELRPQQTFLRCDLADHPMPNLPENCRVEVTRDNVITVLVKQDGHTARGEIAVVGTDAVPHHINIQSDGLGSVLMSALAREAMADGATTGLVFADDPSVYLSLGWEKVADVVVATNDVWRKDMKRRGALRNLVRRWQKGWGAAERVPQPREWHSALRIARGHHVIVTDDGTDRFHLKEVALSHRRGVTLVIPTHFPQRARERALELGLRLRLPQKLMTRALTGHAAPEPSDGYELTVTRTHVIEARVTHNGVEVARGRMSVVGEDAVALDISTDLRHRRQGLASAVLGRLVREAEEDGATAGLLVSSEFGLVFFRAHGWQDEADVVTAYKP